MALVFMASVGAVTAAGPAGATGGTVTCTDVSGSKISASLLFNCLPADTTGGGGSIASPLFFGTHTGTIDWDALSTSAHATTVIHVTTRTVRVKKKNALCPSGTKQLKVSGRVRSDTSGSVTVNGPVSGVLCEDPNGAFALAANTTFSIGG